MFQAASDYIGKYTLEDKIKFTFLWYGYLLGVALCGCLESVSVLMAVRNIIAVNLVKPENIRRYAVMNEKGLTLPVKLNMLAIVAFLGGLISFAFYHYGMFISLPFVVVVVMPCIFGLIYIIAKSIQNLYIVQPWYTSDIGQLKRRGPGAAVRVSENIKSRRIRSKSMLMASTFQRTLSIGRLFAQPSGIRIVASSDAPSRGTPNDYEDVSNY